METRKTIEELKLEALNMLTYDDIFVGCVNELDNLNGFADGFRCYAMTELDVFYFGTPATKLLDDLTDNFNINDKYFYFSVYGLESCGDAAELYRDKVWESELLDDIIDNYNNLDINYIDSELDALIESIVNYTEEEE